MTHVPVVYTRRPVRDRFRTFLLSDSVRNFIWVWYFWFFIGSTHGTFIAYPIKIIVDPMSLGVYDAWVWSPLLATPLALGGLALRHGGSPADQIDGLLLRRDFLGLWMQVGGHAWMAVVLAVYAGTGFYGAQPHQPIPSVWWSCAFLMGASFLSVQSLYKIRLGRRKKPCPPR